LAPRAVIAIAAAEADACDGDCNGNGIVTVEELITAVTIALGAGASSQCAAADRNGNGAVSVAELIGGVGHALRGCPATATPSPSPDVTQTAALPSATPTAVLLARLKTDRGCIESGESPTFAIGEDANAMFRIDGAAGGVAINEARVVIAISIDGQPAGTVDLGPQSTAVLHGTEIHLTGPVGTETLVLTAEGGPGPLVVQAQCSFEVRSIAGELDSESGADRYQHDSVP